jgi:hypothetical protein
MLTPDEIRERLRHHGAEVKPKSSSWVMRFCGWFLAIRWLWLWQINPDFMTRYWTVVWKNVYYPSDEDFDLANDEHVKAHASTFAHEFIHFDQRKKWGILWALSYLLFPVPFFFAWWRWRWEREAYCVNRRNGRSIEDCVNALHKYGKPWPRPWMRRWFEEHTKEDQETQEQKHVA